MVLGGVVNTLCGLTGWPPEDTGNRAIDTYFLFAVAGSVCLMVCYLLVEVATVWFVVGPRFIPLHGGTDRVAGVGFPALGVLVIVTVLWFSVKDASGWSAAPLLGFYWCAAGLAVALAASRIARDVGMALAAELELPESVQVR